MPGQTQATTAKQAGWEHANQSIGMELPFASINEPGCYICNWSGHLVRVPEDGVKPGRSPLLTILGSDPLFVTKISCDPYVPVTKARLQAAQCDVVVNF